MNLELGAWAGRRCFIVGGGPSLRGFDFARLVGELTIGINAAWRMRPRPTVAFALGARFARGDPEWAGRAFDPVIADASPSEHVFMTRDWRPGLSGSLPRGGYWFSATSDEGRVWSQSFDWGLAHGPGGGAGTPAVNLAWLLGARPIYLLGFEHRGEGGKTANFHEHYPEEWQRGEEVYEPMRADLERHAELLRGEVVDLSPNGTLRGFERAAVDDVLA